MTKPERLLLEGGVCVTHADSSGNFRALVMGSNGRTWLVQRRAEDWRWRCGCEAFAWKGRCSHLEACSKIAS